MGQISIQRLPRDAASQPVDPLALCRLQTMGETLYQIIGRHRVEPLPERKPSWLKVRAPGGPNYLQLKHLMRELDLHTVCEEAHCPNVGECWEHGTATFMILGDVCTRNCAYCAVAHGRPPKYDISEPARVADATARMQLRHAVITSVDRDDLPDFGAWIFAETIRQIKQRLPGLLGRSARPRLSGQRGLDPRGARGAPRDLQPQHRDRPAPVQEVPARRPLRARAEDLPHRQAHRAATSRPRPASSSAWARRTRKSSSSCATCATSTSTSSRSASTSARPTPTSRSTATSRRTSSAGCTRSAWRWASGTSSPGRWFARATTPGSRSRRRGV